LAFHSSCAVVMGVSQTFIFVLTFLIIAALVVLVKIKRMEEKDIAIYSFVYKEFEEEGNDEHHEVSGILHIAQVIKRAETDGDLTAVHVEFPQNGQNYIIMLVKVLNYNSHVSSEELARSEKDDEKFWVLISDGAIGTNSITIEINSYVNIDADVEFYGYQNMTVEL